MINLLSIEEKRDIQAARLNVQLLKYMVMVVGGIAFLGIIFLVGYFITSGERRVAEDELAIQKQEAEKYSQVEKEATEFAKNLTIAKSILANEIVYSELMMSIASSLPQGAILSDFVVDNTSLATNNKPITLNTEVDSFETALRMKSSLEDNPLLEHVNIVFIEEKPRVDGQPPPRYPYESQINVSVTPGSYISLGGNQ